VCGTMCDGVGQAAAHVLCLVAPEMSELQRCPGDAAFGVSMVIYISGDPDWEWFGYSDYSV